MRTGRHHLTRITIVILAGLAIAVPTAQAAGQPPDSRAYYRGVEAALAPQSVSPDDRAYSRATPVSSTTKIVSPDDRAFARSTPAEPRALPATVSVRPHGFDWSDALIGSTFGLVIALLAAGAVAIGLRRRREVLRTA